MCIPRRRSSSLPDLLPTLRLAGQRTARCSAGSKFVQPPMVDRIADHRADAFVLESLQLTDRVIAFV